MLTIRRKGDKAYVYGASDEEIEIISDSLMAYSEGSEFSKASQEYDWDGWYRFYQKRWNFFPFGLFERAEKALKDNKIPFVSEGFENRDTSWVKFSPFFTAEDRFYQRDSILGFLAKGYGIIKLPTRGGKSFISSEIMRLLIEKEGAKALFVVDNSDLFAQVPKDISKVTGISENEIGKIQGDKCTFGIITVAMIQTLRNRVYPTKPTKEKKAKKKEMEKFLGSVDLLIIDEIHEYSSSQAYLNTLKKARNARWNLCLSATPFKSLGERERLNVESISGGITYEISEKVLVKAGVLSDSKAILINFRHEKKPWMKMSDYKGAYNRLIVSNSERNEIINSILAICEKLSLKTLAFFSSVEHGKTISKLTGKPFISGENDTKTRSDAKEDFLTGKGGVLLVSDIWKKGITLPSVEIAVNCGGGKEPSLIIQRRGRILGVTETKKKALLFDFIDDTELYLGEHSLGRIEALQEKMPDRKIIVFENDENILFNIEKALKSWFTI